MITIESFNSGKYRNNGDFLSFIPSPINDAWIWSSPEINELLSLADREIGALSAYSELIPDLDIYIRMHIRVEANKSNRIEGTRTSIEEDMLPKENLVSEKRDDVQEIENYIKAMDYGVKRIIEDDFPFSSRFLRELHQILLQGVRGEHKTPGEFRRSQNFIGGSKPSDALYVPPSIADLDPAMEDFDKFANRNDNLPVLIRLAIMHYQFETIHPNILGKPCFYISDYFETHRSEYYSALQDTRVRNDMERWICFFLKASIATARKAKNTFNRVLLLVEKYNQYIAGKKKMHTTIGSIIKEMYSRPIASVAMLSEMTGIGIANVNSAVNMLVNDGILAEITGGKRNRVFMLIEYMKIFSSDDER